ncbi:unnamed protein product [Lactuca virosa]|uniref:Uncharacterized protein n=1 Tax=Lactuca virosa TaxID=75947 RepID=A0AAU9LJJ4_9ASTR|nr:unnamed protein product [Lactuca virosa]
MDSTTNTSGQDTTIPVMHSPYKKIVNMEHDSRKPPLLLSGSQPSSESVDPEPSLEPPGTVTLHEYPVIADPVFKNVKESLPSYNDEALGSEVLLHPTLEVLTVLESIDPSSKDQTPSTWHLLLSSSENFLVLGLDFNMHLTLSLQPLRWTLFLLVWVLLAARTLLMWKFLTPLLCWTMILTRNRLLMSLKKDTLIVSLVELQTSVQHNVLQQQVV